MTTSKPISQLDGNQTLKRAFNEVNDTLTVDGFLVSVVGRKVTQTISTTTIAGDTATFDFSESGTPLYSLKLIFTDGTQSVLISAERIS